MDEPSSRLRILQVSTADTLGGAEGVAWDLFRSYRARGYESWLVVGRKRSGEPAVFPLSGGAGGFLRTKSWQATKDRLRPLARRMGGAARIKNAARSVEHPVWAWERSRGREDFDFPATYRLLDVTPEKPTVVHCHNLHGGYFDLRALPWLSGQRPTFLTLHDAWLLSGHCAHSLGCERWETGCGTCPNLTLYPAIRRDASAFNWQRKRNIYEGSRFYVATPCRWLMERVERSMLAPGIVQARVISNGVDLSVFCPADRPSARAALGVPRDARVLAVAGPGVRRNPWKDYETLHSAVVRVAENLGQPVLCFVLGEDSPVERLGHSELRSVPYQKDHAVVARYLQAADVYVHAARVETMSLSITEALACGTPVVATAVGGIPEQIRERHNGFLVPPGDARAMADGISGLLGDGALWRSLSENAAEDARRRFDLKRQVDTYLDWYQEVVSNSATARSAEPR